MLNIFYNPSYFTVLYKKLLITRQFKYSIFFDLFVRLLYIFNLPYPLGIIISGPQMRIYHLIKTFRRRKDIVFNKLKHDNTYLVQFDKFGQEILNEIIRKNNYKTKVIVGPLYGPEDEQILNNLMNKHPFINKIVASEYALNAQDIDNQKFDKNRIIVCPSGIISSEELLNLNLIKKPEYDCLVYFKKRDAEELVQIKNFLNAKSLRYKILKYGHYNQKEISQYAKNCKFGIIIDKTESQGFAIQELMSLNLPLIIWDYEINDFNGQKVKGTSVPWWDDELCGIKLKSLSDIENNFDKFINNVDKYSPINFVSEHLTYEQFYKNIKNIFNNQSYWDR